MHSCVDKKNAAVWPTKDGGEPIDGGPQNGMDGGGAEDAGTEDAGMNDAGTKDAALNSIYDTCAPALPAASRPACNSDGTCAAGICHIDNTCIEAGKCDENGIATLAISDRAVTRLAVDKRYVYWAGPSTKDYQGNNAGDGKITRVPILGGKSETIKGDVYELLEMVVDSSHIYWNDSRNAENSVTIWQASTFDSEPPRILFEDTTVRSSIGTDVVSQLVQDTGYLYYKAYALKSEDLYLYMLPKIGPTEPIRLAKIATKYLVTNAEITVGDEYVFMQDIIQGIFIGIPKSLNAKSKNTACKMVDLSRGYSDAQVANGRLLYSDCATIPCKVQSCAIDRSDSFVTYTTKENEIPGGLRNYKDKAYLLTFDYTANPTMLAQIIETPSVSTGSSSDTSVLAKFHFTRSENNWVSFDVSASGVFWNQNNRIMRRIHQRPDWGCNTGANDAGVIDLTPFFDMANTPGCNEDDNRLFLIDCSLVFYTRAGNCADAAYSSTLFGSTPDIIYCSLSDSISGPREGCSSDAYKAMLSTIVAHINEPTLGLDSSHKVAQMFP